MTSAATTTRADLLQDLIQVQNHPANWNRDIVSISALLSDGELAAHVRREACKLSEKFSAASEPVWLERIRFDLQVAASLARRAA